MEFDDMKKRLEDMIGEVEDIEKLKKDLQEISTSLDENKSKILTEILGYPLENIKNETLDAYEKYGKRNTWQSIIATLVVGLLTLVVSFGTTFLFDKKSISTRQNETDIILSRLQDVVDSIDEKNPLVISQTEFDELLEESDTITDLNGKYGDLNDKYNTIDERVATVESSVIDSEGIDQYQDVLLILQLNYEKYNGYKELNDVSLFYKFEIIGKTILIYDKNFLKALNTIGIKGERYNDATFRKWTNELKQLHENAIISLNNKIDSNILMQVNDRYFISYKSDADQTNYRNFTYTYEDNKYSLEKLEKSHSDSLINVNEYIRFNEY